MNIYVDDQVKEGDAQNEEGEPQERGTMRASLGATPGDLPRATIGAYSFKEVNFDQRNSVSDPNYNIFYLLDRDETAFKKIWQKDKKKKEEDEYSLATLNDGEQEDLLLNMDGVDSDDN